MYSCYNNLSKAILTLHSRKEPKHERNHYCTGHQVP